jgi:hypothetical protein
MDRESSTAPRILVDFQSISEAANLSADELWNKIHVDIPRVSGECAILKDDLQELNGYTAINLLDLRNDLRSESDKTMKECQSINEQLFTLREELTNARHIFSNQISRRGDAHDDVDEGNGDDDVDDEPGIAVEDQLRIKEQSAKAIEIYMTTLLSTVWQGCSKSTYGEILSMKYFESMKWLKFRFFSLG